MTALPPFAPATELADRRHRFALRGLTWLVWREHRASFRLWIFCSLVLTGYLVYWHARYHATFFDDTLIGPGPSPVGLPPDVGLSAAAFLLLIAPVLAGVVFGAQLFERPFTDGTFALVCMQSASTAAWARARLSVSAAMVVLCVTPCAGALTWDFRVDFAFQQRWYDITMFGAIGPAAVAICLVGLFLGAAAGLCWRRSAPAKCLALALVIAFEAGLSWALPRLLEPTYARGGSVTGDQVPHSAWVLGSGDLAPAGRYVKYLPYSDLPTLQWMVTGICLVVCTALAFACLRLLRRHSF